MTLKMKINLIKIQFKYLLKTTRSDKLIKD